MAFGGLVLAGSPLMGASSTASPYCQVTGGEKLPASSGGARALCAAIERAASLRAPGLSYRIEVRVLSRSMLVAALTANGRKLPEQKYAVSDREISEASLHRFAEAIGGALAQADKG